MEKTKKLCFGLLSNRLYIYLFFFHFSWFFEWDDQLKLESKRSNKLYFKTDEVLFNEPSSKLLAKSLMGSRPHHAFVFVSVCKLRRREYGGCTGSRKRKPSWLLGKLFLLRDLISVWKPLSLLFCCRLFWSIDMLKKEPFVALISVEYLVCSKVQTHNCFGT